MKRTPANTPNVKRKVSPPTPASRTVTPIVPVEKPATPQPPKRKLQRSSSDSSLNLLELKFLAEQQMAATKTNSTPKPEEPLLPKPATPSRNILSVSTPTRGDPGEESDSSSLLSPGDSPSRRRNRSISLDSHETAPPPAEDRRFLPPQFRETPYQHTSNPLAQAQLGIALEDSQSSESLGLTGSSDFDGTLYEDDDGKGYSYYPENPAVPRKSLRQATKNSFNKVRRKIGLSSNAELLPPAPRGQ